MNTKIITAILSLFCIQFVSCASKTELAGIKRDLLFIRVKTESIQEEQRQIRLTLGKLEKTLEATRENEIQIRANLHVQIENLRRQTQILSDRLEDANRQIPRDAADERQETIINNSPAASVSDTPGPIRNARVDNAQELYEAAYQDLVKGQYQLAEMGFRQYIEMEPRSSLSDNALYWIGESFYAQKKYDKAVPEFEKVIKDYPRADKAPAAMLKLGYSHMALRRVKLGSEILQRLKQLYPLTKEAKLAQTRLRELRKSR